MIALIDCRADDNLLSALKKYSFEPVTVPPADYLQPGVASHTDMLVFIGFGRLFCHVDYYRARKSIIDRLARFSGLELVMSDESVGKDYPSDVLFNACTVGKRLVCNTRSVSKLILDAAKEQDYEIIDVPQGYTKCSVCVVSDNAIITADKSISKACAAAGIDILEIRAGHVSLPDYNYGFIGGASGTCGDYVYFCGSLDTHPDGRSIAEFCQKHKKTAISLSGGDLYDVGSIYFLQGDHYMGKSYWNEKYWVRHMRDDDLDNIEDPWIEKYEDIFASRNGKLLDLGCGVGQYSKYFVDKGFSVTSSDISERALEYLSKRMPEIETLRLDMTEPLPFEDNSFDVVFANLSIHFFSAADTENLIKEVRRILKDVGLFIGSCNSSKAYKYIADKSCVIENNFYLEDGGRYVRLFDRAQFDHFFEGWKNIVLCEVETVRFNKSKNMWEFIYENK